MTIASRNYQESLEKHQNFRNLKQRNKKND